MADCLHHKADPTAGDEAELRACLDELERCLARLDRAGSWLAAAQLSHAVETLRAQIDTLEENRADASAQQP